MALCSQGNPCVGPDEVRLLAVLAALQRKRPPALPDLPADLLAFSADCAVWLNGHRLRFDYRLVTPLLGRSAPIPGLRPLGRVGRKPHEAMPAVRIG